MIKQVFNVKHYWRVIVYYNVDYNLFEYIKHDLHNIKSSLTQINRVFYNIQTNRAKAVTISNIKEHTSIILFNKHKTVFDYINSIVHEAEHVKQAMLKAYKISDTGEAPAYTIGFLVMKMMMILKQLLPNCTFN